MKGVGVFPNSLFFKTMIRNKKITSYTPEANWGLTLVEAKRHLNILDSSFDDLINDYITSAHLMLWNEAGLLIKGGVTGYMIEWDDFRIDVNPLDSFSIYYYDSNNTRTLLDSSKYIATNGLYSYVEMKDNLPNLYDRDFPIEIEITTLANTDDMIKQALRMIVADFFENRQSTIVGSNMHNLSRGTKFQMSMVSQRTEI